MSDLGSNDVTKIEEKFWLLKREVDGENARLTPTEHFLVQWTHRLIEGLEVSSDDLLSSAVHMFSRFEDEEIKEKWEEWLKTVGEAK